MDDRALKKRLKQESQVLVPDLKSDLMRQLNIESTPKNPKVKMTIFRSALAFSLLLFALIVFIISTGRKVATNTVVVLDINPSIEMEIDDDNTIRKVRPLNTDGALVLETSPNLIDKNLEEALELLLDNITELEYLDPEDREGRIRIFAANSNQKQETKVIQTLYSNLNKLISVRKMKTKVDNENANDVKQDAKKYKVSIGKMVMVYKAMEVDPSLSIESAVNLNISELNEIARSYSKAKIDDFIQKYKTQIQELELRKQEIRNNTKNQIKAIRTELQEIKNKSRNGGYGKQLREQIKNLIESNFPDYEFHPNIITKAYLDRVIDELLTETDSLDEFLNDVVEENFRVQKKSFEQELKKRIKVENYDFDFQFNQDINLERLLNQFQKNKNARDIIILLNSISTMFDLIDKNPDLADRLEQKITKLYNQYSELMVDKPQEFRDSDLITEFEQRYQDYIDHR